MISKELSTKCHANKKAVYELLTKDVDFSKMKSVCLYSLGHPYFFQRLKKEHPKLEISIVEDVDAKFLFTNFKNTNYVNISNKEFWPTAMNKKFDCIIMNPPYSGNLHLKILEEAMKHSDNVVNLSPVRWLQDPLAKAKPHSDYYKFENSISKKIFKLYTFSASTAQTLFKGALINTNLAIYYLTPEGGYDYKNEWSRRISKTHFEKISKYFGIPSCKQFEEDKDSYFVPFRLITNPARKTYYNVCSQQKWISNRKTPEGKYWKDSLYKSKTLSNDRNLFGKTFTSEIEAKNFYKSTLTIFYKYAVSLVLTDQNINVLYLMWMGNEINPRTGLKGYQSEWTDEDFYEFFDLTDDEIKIIEDTMKKYE